MNWTAEKLDEVSSLWKKGMSASAIALQIGGGATRNAIMGKISRMGLHRHGRVMPRPYKPRPPRVVKPKFTAKEIISVEATAENRKSFSELTSHTCKYGIGDTRSPDFRFCGAPTDGKRPFCDAHASICYNKRDRR